VHLSLNDGRSSDFSRRGSNKGMKNSDSWENRVVVYSPPLCMRVDLTAFRWLSKGTTTMLRSHV
jgi:hypothetical protein